MTVASAWPKPRTVSAAVTGRVAEVLSTPLGLVRGLRSADPEVSLLIARGQPGAPLTPTACCWRCGTAEPAPPPPASRGLDGRAVALVDPGTPEHALFVLTWLNRFSGAHSRCQVAKEAV